MLVMQEHEWLALPVDSIMQIEIVNAQDRHFVSPD